MTTPTTVLAFAAKPVAGKDKTVQVLIYDVIGDDGWGDGFTAKQLRRELEKAGDVDVINLRINSPGGITTDGFAIYNTLRDHPARVEVDIDGDASSMASVIAQAGDVRRMANNAEMMIHEAKLPILGMLTATKLRSLAEHVDIINGNISSVYAARTKQDDDQIRKWMADETFMSAKTAQKRGFVDEVTKAGSKAAAMAWKDVPVIATATEQEPQEQQELPLVASATTQPKRPGTAVPGREVSDMETKSIALALGLGADADEASIVKAVTDQTTAAATGATALAGLATLLTALGSETVEAAVGVIEAGKAAVAQNTELTQRVAALEKTQTDGKREAVIARIEAAGKCTPAQKKDLFPSLDLAGLEAFERTAVRVLGRTGHTEPAGTGAGLGTTGVLTYNGKKFSELAPGEKYRLGLQNRELFDAMKAEAG